MRGRVQEATDLFNESLSILEHRSQAVHPLLLGWVLAWQAFQVGQLTFNVVNEADLVTFGRSLIIAREQNDRALQAFCLRGMVSMGPEARSLLQEALAISRELDDPYMTAYCIHSLAFLAGSTHNMDDSLRLNTEASVIRREIGDLVGLGVSLNNLADRHQRLGNWEEAERFVTECLSLHRKMGSTYGIEVGLANHTLQFFFRHDLANAERNIRDGLSLVRETGHRGWGVVFLYQASLLHLLQGHYDEARAFAEESLGEGLRLVADDQFEALYPRIALGCALCGLREYDAAVPHLYAGLPHAENAPAENISQRYVLTGMAHYYAYSGEPERALELMSTIIHSPLSPPWWGNDEPLAVQLLGDLKNTLSPEAYASAWERGQTLDFDATLEQLIAHIPN